MKDPEAYLALFDRRGQKYVYPFETIEDARTASVNLRLTSNMQPPIPSPNWFSFSSLGIEVAIDACDIMLVSVMPVEAQLEHVHFEQLLQHRGLKVASDFKQAQQAADRAVPKIGLAPKNR